MAYFQKNLIFFIHILSATILALLCLNNDVLAQLQKTEKIIGGSPSSTTQWPWMAGLVKKDIPPFDGIFCGASLIASNWVLTAAHCVIDESNNTLDVIINYAQLDESTGERSAVKRIIIHPLFDNVTLDNDLALLELSTPSTQQPITFLSSYSSQDSARKPVIALGWGTTSDTKNIYPSELHQVDLSIVDNAECSKKLPDVTEKMLCAKTNSAKKDTCRGDSGGPLIVFDEESQSWRQAGITSWGVGCAIPEFSGVYTRIKSYAFFISDNICSDDETPAPAILSLNIDGLVVTANWRSKRNDFRHRLNYAPFPQAQPIRSIDLNKLTHFSTLLVPGNAFYVAITSYNGNCTSNFSNIKHFILK
ncbi:MAG: serine protease [Methylococcaceae bacterium]|nr:serine protease [Methylococcaceae bacterium]